MWAEQTSMKIARAILISVLCGLLAAVVGWFAGDLIGSLLETGSGLGTGLPTVWLMYVLALAFDLLGFAVCLVWQLKSPIPGHPAR
jgi:ABC-type dipeptide/oligopeptide/nickel transport system permease component